MTDHPPEVPERGRAKARTTTAIRFPAALHEQLRVAAAERDLAMNYLVVKAVEDFLPRLKPADEFLTRD